MANAQGKPAWEEYDRLLESRQAIAALSADNVFGDSLDLYSGVLSFSATDVSIPGNSKLPVAVTRKFTVTNREQYGGYSHSFADWELDIPHLSGVFAPAWHDNRCDAATPPGAIGGVVPADEFWAGNHADMPGGGEMLWASTSWPRPSAGGPYKWVTAGNTYFSCLSTIANGTGQGFLAITSDGTRYWFNYMARQQEPSYKYNSGGDYNPVVARYKVSLYATRVEDRFGNWVTYSYSNTATQPVRITQITSNDGRTITFQYNTSGFVSSVSDGSRTWAYGYQGDSLSSVTLPDTSSWQIAFGSLSDARIQPSSGDPRTCFTLETAISGDFTGSITHPSGAIGTYTVGPARFGRSNVPAVCRNYQSPGVPDPSGKNDDYFVLPVRALALTLKSRQISGPGLATGTWTYAWSGSAGSWQYPPGETEPVCRDINCLAPVCLSDACAGARSIAITEPDGSWTKHFYGTSYRYNEGKALSVQRGKGSTVLRTTVYDYNYATSGQPYSAKIGSSPQPRGAGFTSEYPRPQRSRVITQDGATFSNVVIGNSFDDFARPLEVAKSSSLGYGRTEVTAYDDNLSKWVLGQVASVTCTAPTGPAPTGCAGIVESKTDYDPTTALPIRIYGPGTTQTIGKLQQTLTYNTAAGTQAGTLATVKDGNNHVTTLSNWKRGIPQTITYPATTDQPTPVTQKATVDDHGWITSVTDENSARTCYGYDAMGRIDQITYPSESALNTCSANAPWAITTLSFQQVAATEYGIPANHWRQTISTGNGRKVTYFDALWRPVVTREFDTANQSGTERFQRFAYDPAGRVGFASYPGSVDNLTTGTWTLYDALGRPTSVSQDSEYGLLTTRIDYLSGFLIRVTNPNLQSTTTSFMAWDQPGTELPVAIVHPLGTFTDIERDAFGKPTALTRRNANGSVSLTRRYVYDDVYQELCKTIEPETGATIMAYDNAGNLAWSKSGSTYTSTASCNTSDIPTLQRTTRTYDARNRVQALMFPDNQGNTSYGYTPDNKLDEVTVDNGGTAGTVDTTYSYNQRGLPTNEVLAVGSHLWSIGYSYNANGHLAAHTLPGGLAVDYAPNALGQPTRAGVYATGAQYFPNGALKQFTYGNGIVHTLTQNPRGLPERSRDAYGSTAVHDDSLDYDPNGNVLAISDGLGGDGNRDMTYDGLDRLTDVASPMFGAAHYTYDVLDNLRTLQLTAGPKVRNHTYVYDAANRLTNVTQTVGGGTVIGLGYDTQGNLANRNGVLYDFDAGNRLRAVTGVEQYRYDGHGRRVQAIANGASIYSVYGQDGALRFQRDERVGKSTQYVSLAGSLVAMVEDPIPLATPALTVPGYSSDGSYTVSWTSSAVATKYQLQEQFNGGGWTTVHDAAGTSRAFSGKAAGSYGYRVRACSATACGGWSATATVTVQLPPTGVPTLTAPDTGLNGSYTVGWTAVTAADRYELQERQGSGAWSLIHNAAATSKAVSGKATGSWSYQVRACNDAGCGAYSAIDTVQVIHPPTGVPPLTVPATNYTGSYSVSWTAVSTATRYELEERKNSDAWILIHNDPATSKAILDKTAASWSYRVRACNEAGCGAYSATKAAQVTLPPAGAPTLTVPTPNYTGSYNVSWTTVGAATRYELWERLGSGGWSLIQNTSASSRALSGKPAGAWGYQVRACNVAGCGAYSAIKTAQVTLPPASAPTLTAPASSSTGNYPVSWSAVAAATTYRLEERVNGGGWTLIQDTGATSKALNGKAAGTYDYRVRACNVAGCSGYSAMRTVQVSLPLTAPSLSGPTSSTTDFSFTLTWTTIAGATRYELQQSRNSGSWSTAQDSPATSSTQFKGLWGTYRYQVRACSATACSPYSAIHTVVVTQSNNLMAPPAEEGQ